MAEAKARRYYTDERADEIEAEQDAELARSKDLNRRIDEETGRALASISDNLQTLGTFAVVLADDIKERADEHAGELGLFLQWRFLPTDTIQEIGNRVRAGKTTRIFYRAAIQTLDGVAHDGYMVFSIPTVELRSDYLSYPPQGIVRSLVAPDAAKQLGLGLPM